MPSPFPGMDPYLEDQGYWPDFHLRFMNYWCEAIADRLPENYEARLEERVRFVELLAGESELKVPDLSVEQRRPSVKPAPGSGGTLTLRPVTLSLPVMQEVRESRVQILHRPGRTLVTVLELLSPGNKSSSGQGDYLAKRIEVLCHRPRIHLVELDLLAGGQRLPMRRPLPPGDYYALVSRGERRPKSEVYAWSVRRTLPAIPVPLKGPDVDLLVDLQAVFHITYERGRYDRSVDYDAPLALPLDAKDRRWAARLAKARKGSRRSG